MLDLAGPAGIDGDRGHAGKRQVKREIGDVEPALVRAELAAIDPVDVRENSDLNSEMAEQERCQAIGMASAVELVTPGLGLADGRL
jgi:hypothetical protein